MIQSFLSLQLLNTVCEDLSTKCKDLKTYCGKNDYVTKRCKKTCGTCSKLICFQILQYQRFWWIQMDNCNFLQCSSAELTTEAPSTNNPPTTTETCEDMSPNCNKYKKNCGTNSYVTKHCQKTCGVCSKSLFWRL